MMVGVVEVVVLAGQRRGATAAPRDEVGWIAGSVTVGGVGLAVLVVLGFMFEVLPGAGRQFHDAGKPVYAWGPFRKTATGERRPGRRVVAVQLHRLRGPPAVPRVLRRRADDGRASARPTGAVGSTWENNDDNGQYGTTMALMLLPHWTDGCMASMEGLFFEASGTTPYHFLTTAAMSKQSSNPVRELRYDNNDAAKGVPYLQALGVRYVMVRTDEAKRRPRRSPS